MSYTNTKAVRDYRDYTTARGVNVRVHAVPQPIIRSIVPKRPKPIIPTVTMQLPKGTQKRPANEKDAVWASYMAELDEWNHEARQLQEAVTFCLALKEYKFPDVLSTSPEIQGLIDAGLVKLPDDPYQRKLMWLRENVMGEHDEYEITMIIQQLSGVPEDIINEMKESFRNTLLGKNTPAVGTDTDDEPAPEEGDAVQ